MHIDHDNTPLDLCSVDDLFRLAVTSQDADQAWSAIERLQSLDTEIVFAEAVRLCHRQDARQRQVGVDVLGQWSLPQQTSHESIVQALLTLLETEDSPEVLASLGVALGHRGDARAIRPLLALQQHPDPDVRHGVVFGLLGHTDPRAIDCLIALSADSDVRVRDWATFGLAVQIDTDTPELRAALLARLHDSDGDTAGEAMVGLARRKDRRVVAPLLELLQSGHAGSLPLEAAALADPVLLPTLQLYVGTTSRTDLLTLQDFYNGLDRQRVPYALPRIYSVAEEADVLLTIEQRLAGTQLSTLLPTLPPGRLEVIMQRYLDAALALARLQPPPSFDRYKLFDPNHMSLRAAGDWHQFLVRYLTHKLAQVSPYLIHDVPQFAGKIEQPRMVLDQPYRGDYRLIHGDYFPGNLLVDADTQITALLDFGLLTMYGDVLFDLATGWVFFDMYDELKAQVRERCLAMLLDRLGEQVRGKLFRYVLIYSILSANTYSPQCRDGHYHWCVDNLSNQDYWSAID